MPPPPQAKLAMSGRRGSIEFKNFSKKPLCFLKSLFSEVWGLMGLHRDGGIEAEVEGEAEAEVLQPSLPLHVTSMSKSQ